MEKKLRSNHCDFKILNQHGKCVAPCRWLLASRGEFDCIGKSNPAKVPDKVDAVRGRVFKL